MKYWDDMLTKYGFSDGESTPDGIEVFRDVYLKVVNELARRNNSQCRYIPFDRPGVHNYCMVSLVSSQWFDETYLPSQEGQKAWQAVEQEILMQLPVPKVDEALRDAVSKACDLYLDQQIDVTVSVDPGFAEFLAGPMLTEDEEYMDEDWEEELEEQEQD